MRFAFFAALAISPVLSLQPVAAESMMRPGASPEAGLKGVWRAVSAKAAPWAAPGPVTKKNAPLLEYAVEFADGEVKGPAPLACKAAKYASGVQDQSEAFGGRLAKDASFVQKLNLPDGGPSLFRVYCGKETRDYYFDKDAALIFAEGGIVYTLKRPEGMDLQQYKAGYSGPSFDCTKAKATNELAICHDAALSKSDRALAEAYGALKRSLPQSSFATFQAGQRSWLAYVNKVCGADAAMPEAAGDERRIAECLAQEFDSRTTLLKDLKVEKAGALVLEPRMRFRADAEKHIEETEIYPYMSGGPQAEAFNAFISKTFDLGKWLMDDKEMFQTADDTGEMRFHAHRFYSVARSDGKIVSFQVSGNDYTGGNRDNLTQGSYTWDLQRGRLVTLADIFAAGTNWKKAVAALCKEELENQPEGPEPGAISDEEIAAAVKSDASWLWGKHKATIVFMPGTIGGLPAGEIDVEIAFEKLKPYLKPDAPMQ